jgi:hypothetical protein
LKCTEHKNPKIPRPEWVKSECYQNINSLKNE